MERMVADYGLPRYSITAAAIVPCHLQDTSKACLPSMSAGQHNVQDVSRDNAVLKRK